MSTSDIACDFNNASDAFATADGVACTQQSGYKLSSLKIPTGDDLVKVCSTQACTNLMKLLSAAIPTDCVFAGVHVKNDFIDVYPKVCFGVTSSPTTTTPSPTVTPTPSPTAATSSSGSSMGLIGGIVGGLIMVLALVAVFMWKRRRERKSATLQPDLEAARPPSAVTAEVDYLQLDAKRNSIGPPRRSSNIDRTVSTARSSQRATATSSVFTASSSGPASESTTRAGSRHRYSVGSNNSSGSNEKTRLRSKTESFWEDPAILTIRIPRDMIFFGPLISRGGYGEVFKGTYKGETVAIKQLLPERRKHIAQIDEFLAEVKLMASLEHERVVRFIGVAWTALSDACVVVEYMERGDLRSVVTQWDARNKISSNDNDGNDDDEEEEASPDWRPRGFDADKVKIAVHIAHALTYLHSLQPVVVHRDLKSKNILLNENLDAKVTDFGVSRERADATMTAGVGSSLWMAPEVMVGERYDEKADVFSFGVVLSELDTHQLPYWHASEPGTGRKLPDLAVLQLVSLGRLRVAFSEGADADLVQLALECVSVDPSQRPTAAQALHRVHSILRSNY